MKGQLWCAHLPLTTMEHRDRPQPITLLYPYYENAQFLGQQIAGWWSLPPDLPAHVSLIVVDDGSPEHPAADVLRAQPLPFGSCRAFRIETDVRWNWLAARNIGFYYAADGWVLVTDMDHVVPAETLRAVLYGVREEAVAYFFSRREASGQRIAPHSASFLLTRDCFWEVGGYDEALSGYYGTDGDWRRRLARVTPLRLLPEVLIRHEYEGDSSTKRYKRKQPEDAAVRGLIAKRGQGWRPRVLSFPYHEEALS